MYDVIAGVRQRIADHQAILYLLCKPDSFVKFERDPQLLNAIESGDIDFVRKWFKTDLDSLSLSELRDLARREGVRPVYGKSRAVLILEIMEKRCERDTSIRKEQLLDSRPQNQ